MENGIIVIHIQFCYHVFSQNTWESEFKLILIENVIWLIRAISGLLPVSNILEFDRY